MKEHDFALITIAADVVHWRKMHIRRRQTVEIAIVIIKHPHKLLQRK